MPDLSRFVRVSEACQLTGLTSYTLDRRLIAGEVPIFRDPTDRRRRLILVDDLSDLVSVIPFERHRQRTAEQVAS